MMTREEASKHLFDDWYIENGRLCVDESNRDDFCKALGVGIKALRPISREQVEKVWRGKWMPYLDGEHIMPERYYRCSKCGDRGYMRKRNFCPHCGTPMKDEAVEMVMERLEALYGQENT